MTGNTPAYNLKAVIHETGLTPATLRAWERRYALFKPQRSPGGHRLYSQNEIELLKWLVARQAEGLSISHAIHLWRAQQSAVLQSAAQPSSLAALRAAWIEACFAFDEPAAEQTLAQAFALASPEDVCIHLLQKGLAEIGEGWYAGRVSIQQEHFASALAMRRLHTLYAAAPQPIRPGRILAACPPGELHEFSLLLLAYMLRRRGWDVIYLGVNVPFSQLGETIQQVTPRLVLSVAQTLTSAAELRGMAAAALEHGAPLAFGGGIFNQIPSLAACIPGYFLGSSMENAPEVIEACLRQPGSLPEQYAQAPETQALLTELSAHSLQITAAVTAALQSDHFAPAHLEEANASFTNYLMAALKLGDLEILAHVIDWLEGLLENYGLPAAAAGRYLQVYAQIVEQQLGSRAAPIVAWLSRFTAV